ncbi:MAG TPA: hypothetical protein VN039_11675 [Nitrospira sp.]|nr:hypothetical protein [Nitrospira sp.]
MKPVKKRSRVHIGFPQPWTRAQVEKLNKLVLASEFGEKPVFIRTWPGPALPSEPVPHQCWVRFVELPEVMLVKRDFHAVKFAIEQVPDPSVKRAMV